MVRTRLKTFSRSIVRMFMSTFQYTPQRDSMLIPENTSSLHVKIAMFSRSPWYQQFY